MRTDSRVLRTWSRRWRKRARSDTENQRRDEKRERKKDKEMCAMWTRLWKSERTVVGRLKARCDAAGACNNVTFISLIRVGRSHPPIHGGGLRRYYLISNVIAYLITPTICIHRRVVGRESFFCALPVRGAHERRHLVLARSFGTSLPRLVIFHHNYI